MARRNLLVLAIRLAVYAAALVFVLRTQPSPEPSGPPTVSRVAPESERPHGISILQVTIIGVLLVGVGAECLGRRPAWR